MHILNPKLRAGDSLLNFESPFSNFRVQSGGEWNLLSMGYMDPNDDEVASNAFSKICDGRC